MLRSIWKRALVTTFAWAGLAWAQQPITSSGPAAKPAQSPEQYFSVQEPGKPGQKCQVLKIWKTREGKTAYQVKALDTGEMMTIVETGAANNQSLYPAENRLRVQAVASRIFHWGSDRMPPPGTPMPPIEYVQTVPSATPRPEVAKMASAAHPEAAKLVAPAQPEPTKPPAAARTEPTKSYFTLPWFSRATDPRVSQAQTNALPGKPSGSALMTQPTTTVQNKVTTTVPGPASIGEPVVQTPAQSSLPQNNSFGSTSISQPKTAAPDNRFGSTPVAQPKVIFQDAATNQPRTTVQNKPSSTPDKPSATLAPPAPLYGPYFPASAAVASPTTPQRAVAPERVVQVVPPRSEATSPATTTTSAAPDTRVSQTNGLPGNTSGSAPMTQPTTTVQNKVTTTVPGPASVREPGVQTPAQTSLPQNNSFGSTSISQPKTAAPDNRFGSTLVAQPKVILQDTAMNPPRTTVQNKPSSTPDKPSDTLWPRAPMYSPYFLASPAVASPTTPQPTVAPERVVQVGPPRSEATSPATTTTSTAPAALAPKSDLLNRQAVPIVPGSKMTVPPASEKKPPVPAPVFNKPSVTIQTTTPFPSAAPANANAPKGPVMSVPTTAVLPRSSAGGTGATPMKRIDDTKPVATGMAPSMGTTATKPVPVTATKPVPVTAAAPTDWRKSWSPTDDGKAQTTDKPAQSPIDSKPAPAKAVLPQADSKRPDPLQMPTRFDRRPVDEKPSAQKHDTMVLPPVAAASTPTIKPVVATVAEPTKTQPSAVSVPVPTTAVLPRSSDPGGTGAAPMKRIDDTKPVTTGMAPSMGTTVIKPVPVTAAPPTDWRKSWGQTDDGKAQTTDKSAQSPTDSKPAPAKPVLPQADSKRPDPLQVPTIFDRRPVDEKPSAQKYDTMVLPPVAAASTPTIKPVAATVAEPTKTQPSAVSVPVGVPVSMPVPLGAQSVIQAGDPGPGGVRYIPVPIVTIPDVRRAPVPPMTTPAQVYGMSGTVPAASAATQANAFTPALSRQAVAQSSNAFGVPAAPFAPPTPAPAAAGMIAQAMHPAGSNNPTNPTLINAGIQGAALASQTVPAAYHATTSQVQPPYTPLTGVKPTPENIQQMVAALRDSLYPSQREWAAENMSALDWQTHLQVVQVLMTAAREDPAATVRAGCVRCLANMKVNTMPVFSVLRDLKNDIDPRVRQEVDRALSVLAVGEK